MRYIKKLQTKHNESGEVRTIVVMDTLYKYRYTNGTHCVSCCCNGNNIIWIRSHFYFSILDHTYYYTFHKYLKVCNVVGTYCNFLHSLHNNTLCNIHLCVHIK